MSFGQYISTARKKLGLTQKELAARLYKEDGDSISPQYLNDIEHDRRNAPSEHVITQLAHELNLSHDYLLYLAGQYPADLKDAALQPEQVERFFVMFRQELGQHRHEVD